MALQTGIYTYMTLHGVHVCSHVETQVKAFCPAKVFIPAQLLQAQKAN